MFSRRAVVALGGNAITREFEDGDIYQQFANTRKSLLGIAKMIQDGYLLAVTHGNGPQIGNFMLRVEATRSQLPPIPLGVMVADLCGGMGYMIAQSIQNKLKKMAISREVLTIPSQVIVDEKDPSMLDPDKFVGSFYSRQEAAQISKSRGWSVKEDREGKWRRVVPSPKPLATVEAAVIKELFEAGRIVITAGGGGIPVYRDQNGMLEGINGVVDKDLSSAVLAIEIGAEELYLLTTEEKVYLNYRKPSAQAIDSMTIAEAETHLADGQFPAGSMGPKVTAGVQFLRNGGKLVIITSVDKHLMALSGATGTRIVPE